MTWYRKRAYPADGLVDDPDEVWTEFQRLRGAITGIDQNNWRQNGIERKRIVKPVGAHNGPSDIATATSSIPWVYFLPLGSVNTQAEHDGIWQDTPAIELNIDSRMEGPWVVAACARFSIVLGALGYSHGEIRVAAASTGPSASIGTAFLNSFWVKDGTALALTSLLLPAGPSAIRLQHRVTWGSPPTGDVTLAAASMWAFGLYR